MLKLLRKKGVSKKILWFIAIIIVLSFGVFGSAYLLVGKQQADDAGTLYGRKVPLKEFQKAYQAVYIEAFIKFGDKLNELSRFLNLEAEAWDRLILLREAQKRNIKINDEEVVQTISEYPFFQRDGHFDDLLYKDVLHYALRISQRNFEENVRDKLKFVVLFQQITASVKVSEQEILDVFKRENEKVQVSYVLIMPDQFIKDVAAQEDEAKNYYARNKNAFLVPPTINVEYISLDFPDPKPEPAQGETTDAAATPPEDPKKSVQEKAEKIFQDLLVNPDMQATAPKYNVEVKTSGFFSQEEPNLSLGWSYELLNKIFQMAENAVNEPFETPRGMLIAKIKEKKESYVPEHAQVADKVKEAVLKGKAKEVARKKAEEYLAQIKEEFGKTKLQDFAQTSKTLGLEIHQTPVFGRGEYLPVVGIAKDFQEAAFALTQENRLSGVVETEVGYSVLHRDSYVPADEKQSEERKEKLSESLLNSRRSETFNNFLNNLRMKANITSDIPSSQRDPAGQQTQ
ncbi:MAG: SurA N-terminal domain-containing protein [Candidatus Omnitrophica bacterium]|nr:SurA N-terminal domain-containing protein [Candidatus Omnitrophota bacterium]